MDTSWDTYRLQTIYLTREVGPAARITALALKVVTDPNQVLNLFTIRMKHTSLSAYGSSPAWESTGWTTVYQTNLNIDGTGWVIFTLSKPFDYNGINNLMIDFSFSNEYSFFTSGEYQATDISTRRSLLKGSYYGGQVPLSWAGYDSSATVELKIPNIQISTTTVVPIDPVNASFVNGQWSGAMLVKAAATNLVLEAVDLVGHAGASLPMTVIPWVDSDGDGLPDDWELAHNLNPNNPGDRDLDPDGDGLTNKQEYLAGTDPHDASSSLRLSLVRAGDDKLNLAFASRVGKMYRLETAVALPSENWSVVMDNLYGTGQIIQIQDVNQLGTGTEVQYFRLQLMP
jgi:hypothetical protein